MRMLKSKYLLTVLCVALATAFFVLGRDYFAKGQWALLYLLVISLIARLWGVRPAMLAALLAFLAWNFFFLPPYYTFSITDPKDWLSLLVFLIVGALIGFQTGRMREREAEALAGERDTALLNRFGEHLVSDIEVSDLAKTVGEIAPVIGSCCAVLFIPSELGELKVVGSSADLIRLDDEDIKIMSAWTFSNVKAVGLPDEPVRLATGTGVWPISVGYDQAGSSKSRRDVFIPLQSASRLEGVLYAGERQDGRGYTPQEARLLVAIANQSAAFLERKRLQSEAVLVDALRESDKMKSVLMSSVSHELKTPLASATATITNLLQTDIKLDDTAARGEIQAIQDDLERLNNSISSLIDLSRLEAATWTPKIEVYELGEILATVLSKTSPRQKTRIVLSIGEDLPAVRVDFTQWVQALQNVLENALAYSPGDKEVTIGASRVKDGLEIWMADEGPGIPPEERQHVFDKFFRGRQASKSPMGTGLGLAVTREIVNYHGGRIRIEDASPQGTRVVITLPNENLSEASE